MMNKLAPHLLAAALLSQTIFAQHEDIDGNGDGQADGMGPAAFMWPPDRVWLEFTDNVGPCGSLDGPKNRTKFPITNGAVSLVQQDEAFDVQIAISYSNDPQKDTDFDVLITPERLKELDPGHQCLNITSPPSNISPGANATIQVKYISDMENNRNETYYACADITYVSANEFNYATLPCFNATIPELPSPSSSTGSGSSPAASGTNAADSSAGSTGGSGGLSGGAIAGIVVGVVVGVAALGILLFFLYRRDQRQKRVAEHVTSARNNVKWDADNRSGAESGNSVPLENLSR